MMDKLRLYNELNNVLMDENNMLDMFDIIRSLNNFKGEFSFLDMFENGIDIDDSLELSDNYRIDDNFAYYQNDGKLASMNDLSYFEIVLNYQIDIYNSLIDAFENDIQKQYYIPTEVLKILNNYLN